MAQDPFVSPDSYCDFLLRHRSARARLRERVGGLGPDEYWVELQARDDAALAADIAALGVRAPALPATTSTRIPTSADAGRGVLYVLEGSKLGARTLRARLSERLGEQIPQSFLATGDPRRWADACRELEASQDLDVVIGAATWSFEVFAESFAAGPVYA